MPRLLLLTPISLSLPAGVIAYGYRNYSPPLERLLAHNSNNDTALPRHLYLRSSCSNIPSQLTSLFCFKYFPTNLNCTITGNSLFFRMEVTSTPLWSLSLFSLFVSSLLNNGLYAKVRKWVFFVVGLKQSHVVGSCLMFSERVFFGLLISGLFKSENECFWFCIRRNLWFFFLVWEYLCIGDNTKDNYVVYFCSSLHSEFVDAGFPP